MATRVRLRRGTTAQHASFTGVEGEVTVDTDKKTAVVHDGSTAGGHDLLRADARRGWIRSEHFVNNGTWTKNNKPDLKRIEVHAYGGGGGGSNDTDGGSGGGSGGYGYRVIEVSDISTQNVAVTIGQGGSGGANAGTAGSAGNATTFGSYITANGGVGPGNANFGGGAPGGNATGTGVINLGGYAGDCGEYSATANNNYGWSWGAGGGHGGSRTTTANGVFGGGGGGGGTGAPGSVMVYEIYGEY